LLHDQTTQGTLFTLSAFTISCNKLHATILLFSGHLMAHASQRVPITDRYKKARVRKRAPSKKNMVSLTSIEIAQGVIYKTLSYPLDNKLIPD